MLLKQKPLGLITELGILASSRTVINTGFRMVYALLPVFSRELNVELTRFALLLTAIQLLGLSAPFLGTIPERFGRRFTILIAMMLFNLGMLIVFIMPNFIGFSIALITGAIAKIMFDPTVQAYIGERVPYEKRGMALGIIELAWSGAFFLGVPLMTWLMASFNWQMPFAALAILGTIGFMAMAFAVRENHGETRSTVSFISALRISVSTRAAVAGIGLFFAICAANQLIGVVFATWIEDSFGIMLSSLALASVVIGIAELGGEGIVVFFSDRFDKRILIFAGIGINILICMLLPFMGFNLGAALVGLFFFYISFELGLVASLPLLIELSPSSRAMYMTVIVVASTVGRAMSTFTAPYLYDGGLFANCALALGLNLIACFLLWRYVRLD